MGKTVIIIPTYNEKENIGPLFESIRGLGRDYRVLVVDDDSPDGTAQVVQDMKKSFPGLEILKRESGRGFGRSYLAGFNKAIDEDFEVLVMMDADLSHDPKEIPEMTRKLSECDAVIGSRYANGGRIENWKRRRRLLSRFANLYAGTILGAPIRDLTTGFMCFHKGVLRRVDLDSIKSEGYGFLIDLKYRIFKAGFRVCEHPIVFNERREGQSKMSFKNIWEAVWLPWRLKFSKK